MIYFLMFFIATTIIGIAFTLSYAKEAKEIKDLHEDLINRHQQLQRAANATDDEMLVEVSGENDVEMSIYAVRVKVNPELPEGSFNLTINEPYPKSLFNETL